MITQEELNKIADEFTVGDRPYSQEIELVVFNGTPAEPFTAEQMRLFLTTIKLLRDNGIKISLQRLHQNGSPIKPEDRVGRMQMLYQQIPLTGRIKAALQVYADRIYPDKLDIDSITNVVETFSE